MDAINSAKDVDNSFYSLSTTAYLSKDGRVDFSVFDKSTEAIDDIEERIAKDNKSSTAAMAFGAIVVGGGIILASLSVPVVGWVVVGLGGCSVVYGAGKKVFGKNSKIEDSIGTHLLRSANNISDISDGALKAKSKMAGSIETAYLTSDQEKADQGKSILTKISKMHSKKMDNISLLDDMNTMSRISNFDFDTQKAKDIINLAQTTRQSIVDIQ